MTNFWDVTKAEGDSRKAAGVKGDADASMVSLWGTDGNRDVRFLSNA